MTRWHDAVSGPKPPLRAKGLTISVEVIVRLPDGTITLGYWAPVTGIWWPVMERADTAQPTHWTELPVFEE